MSKQYRAKVKANKQETGLCTQCQCIVDFGQPLCEKCCTHPEAAQVPKCSECGEPATDDYSETCEQCCDHSDSDSHCCLICGKDLTEDRMCAAYDRWKDSRYDD